MMRSQTLSSQLRAATAVVLSVIRCYNLIASDDTSLSRLPVSSRFSLSFLLEIAEKRQAKDMLCRRIAALVVNTSRSYKEAEKLKVGNQNTCADTDAVISACMFSRASERLLLGNQSQG
ncbi:hypothetical protein F5Y18DRAFT_394685 [Xylariaceae sp. FL1019]|nr:hypothetical protein F5Y18DRAFT_394685 [Xylariaceae sp. FL1019]